MMSSANQFAWARPTVPTLPGDGDRVMLPDSMGNLVPAVSSDRAEVKIYVCGITPYDATHLGHAATYLLFDVLIRTLLDSRLDVRFVENVTDVDDPLFERSAQTGIDWRTIASEQTDLFVQDMRALNVIPPDDFVLTSEQVLETAALVKRLKDKGVTYQIGDKTYLDLGGFTLLPSNEDLTQGQLIELSAQRGGDPQTQGKRNPLDPIIWVNTDSEPHWQTPVGKGRPGWHVECVSIVESFLGLPIDIQGGGTDLEFPHHQMCANTVNRLEGKQFARHYVYSGLVWFEGHKMSKSLGNLVFVSQLVKQGHDPMAIRLALLDRDWQKDLPWHTGLLDDATARLSTWQKVALVGADATSKTARHFEAKPVETQQARAHLNQVRKALAKGVDLASAIETMDAWAQGLALADASSPHDRRLFANTADALLGVKLVSN